MEMVIDNDQEIDAHIFGLSTAIQES